jgi:hypothetical protein
MEEKAKPNDGRDDLRWQELREQAKNDSEFDRKLEAAKRINERNSDTVQRLADS